MTRLIVGIEIKLVMKQEMSTITEENSSAGPPVLATTAAPMTERPDADALAIRIDRMVRSRSSARIRDLKVEYCPQGILLTGKCGNFYTKQLAQQAAMDLANGKSVSNLIRVA